MAAIDAVLVGAGLRGRFTYGRYALAHPDRLRIVAVAEPDPARRRALAREHHLPAERSFHDWKPLLDSPRRSRVAIVATGDTLHVDPVLAAIERGYDVLLEKPIAPEVGQCFRMVEAAERRGCMLQVGHVLRYAPFYRKIHALVVGGALGRVLSVDMQENVVHWHMAHSYVRGKFRNRREAAPFVLAKTCHDLDLLAWIVGYPAEHVASFGSLGHFRRSSAPADTPKRCTDGCPVQEACPHDAVRFYLAPDDEVARLWPWTDLSSDPAREARRSALETSPYGRCVYRCDNDVPDHQMLGIEFEGGVTATFTVQGLAWRETRTIRISGSRGELQGVLHDGVLELRRHGSLEVERHCFPTSPLGHFGGDDGLLDHFTDVVARGAAGELLTSGREVLEGHLIGFAAERARESRRVVELDSIRAEASARGAALHRGIRNAKRAP
jgi:predicted dehydrogenase